MSLIRVLDFETAATEPPGEVCEVGWTDYSTDLGLIEGPRSRLCRVATMPPEVRAIHHISLAETLDAMPWDGEQFMTECARDGIAAIAAHNLAFEQQWLPPLGEIWAICTYKVALRAWPQAPSHSNGALRYWLEDDARISRLGEAAMPPHRAGPDSLVTAHILKALFATGITGGRMTAWSRQPAVLPRCPIGEHRNKAWADVPWGFLNWMVTKAHDMDPDLKWNAQRELDRRASEGR